MPIYEYRCQTCGHTLDALQKVNDPHLTDCPACDEPALRRLMSAPAFRLKGAGWYETDFKTDKEKKRNLVDAKPEKGGDDKSASDKGASDKGASDKPGKADSASAESKKTGEKKEPKGKEPKGTASKPGTGTEAA
jgi:putative FmdB family regulatory protein